MSETNPAAIEAATPVDLMDAIAALAAKDQRIDQLERELAAAQHSAECLRDAEQLITALEKSNAELREALKEMIDLVTSEYCSHKEPCGNIPPCYARKGYAALNNE